MHLLKHSHTKKLKKQVQAWSVSIPNTLILATQNTETVKYLRKTRLHMLFLAPKYSVSDEICPDSTFSSGRW